VLLVHGIEGQSQSDVEQADRVLSLLVEELPVKQAVALASKITGAKKNALYQQALRMQSGNGET
jgi:16S rRNA (cytidine1402-2'-O)-methyltransferase